MSRLRLFLGLHPLQSVAINILGPLLRTKASKRFISVFTHWYTKLTQATAIQKLRRGPLQLRSAKSGFQTRAAENAALGQRYVARVLLVPERLPANGFKQHFYVCVSPAIQRTDRTVQSHYSCYALRLREQTSKGLDSLFLHSSVRLQQPRAPV